MADADDNYKEAIASSRSPLDTAFAGCEQDLKDVVQVGVNMCLRLLGNKKLKGAFGRNFK